MKVVKASLSLLLLAGMAGCTSTKLSVPSLPITNERIDVQAELMGYATGCLPGFNNSRNSELIIFSTQDLGKLRFKSDDEAFFYERDVHGFVFRINEPKELRNKIVCMHWCGPPINNDVYMIGNCFCFDVMSKYIGTIDFSPCAFIAHNKDDDITVNKLLRISTNTTASATNSAPVKQEPSK